MLPGELCEAYFFYLVFYTLGQLAVMHCYVSLTVLPHALCLLTYVIVSLGFLANNNK